MVGWQPKGSIETEPQNNKGNGSQIARSKKWAVELFSMNIWNMEKSKLNEMQYENEYGSAFATYKVTGQVKSGLIWWKNKEYSPLRSAIPLCAGSTSKEHSASIENLKTSLSMQGYLSNSPKKYWRRTIMIKVIYNITIARK